LYGEVTPKLGTAIAA